MRRAATVVGMAAALVVATAALGTADLRVHRLHVPPPLVESEGAPGVNLPGAPPSPAPSAPATRTDPAPPGPPVPPAGPPPPPGAVSCDSNAAGAPIDATGQLIDQALALTPTALSAAATLRIRGVNQGLEDHTIAIRRPGGAFICGTPIIAPGTELTFAVSHLEAGTYQVYCTIHAATMRQSVIIT
jgi:plastocyanin